MFHQAFTAIHGVHTRVHRYLQRSNHCAILHTPKVLNSRWCWVIFSHRRCIHSVHFVNDCFIATDAWQLRVSWCLQNQHCNDCYDKSFCNIQDLRSPHLLSSAPPRTFEWSSTDDVIRATILVNYCKVMERPSWNVVVIFTTEYLSSLVHQSPVLLLLLCAV